MASWTLAQLETLENAIASGTLEVRYSDKSVKYRDLDEMLKIRDMMRSGLGLISGQTTRLLSEFDKGL
jgi:hypothetical protein